MVHTVLDNERINTILRIAEASEDTISEAIPELIRLLFNLKTLDLKVHDCISL